jgi:hypothetical protein
MLPCINTLQIEPIMWMCAKHVAATKPAFVENLRISGPGVRNVLMKSPFLDLSIKLANVQARLRHCEIDGCKQAPVCALLLYRRKSWMVAWCWTVFAVLHGRLRTRSMICLAIMYHQLLNRYCLVWQEWRIEPKNSSRWGSMTRRHLFDLSMLGDGSGGRPTRDSSII